MQAFPLLPPQHSPNVRSTYLPARARHKCLFLCCNPTAELSLNFTHNPRKQKNPKPLPIGKSFGFPNFGLHQQFRTFASTKQKSQNSKNNCWTQYQKPYVFITAQFDIFIVFFYFPQTVYWKMNHIKRFCVIFI